MTLESHSVSSALMRAEIPICCCVRVNEVIGISTKQGVQGTVSAAVSLFLSVSLTHSSHLLSVTTGQVTFQVLAFIKVGS